MAPDTSFSPEDLDDLTKPLAKNYGALLNKVSNAAGVLYKPFHIRRKAKARGHAALTEAEHETASAEIYRRAEHRRREEDARHQKNMENILEKALPRIDEGAEPNLMDNDWTANYIEKCRIVSDDKMQDLWARVLAGEANAPGSYSKRTVNFLSEMDKPEAEMFTNLCGFGWHLDEGAFVPLVFDFRSEIYHKCDINFETLSHLERISLITFDSVAGFVRSELPKTLNVYYYDTGLVLHLPDDNDKQLAIGAVFLTRIGQELAPICGSEPVEGFWEYVKDKWKRYLPE